MKVRLSLGLWPRLALAALAVALLGIAPLPHAFNQSLHQARRSIDAGSPLPAAQAVARAAQLMPWRSDLWERAGLFALEGGDPAQAVEHLRQASRADRLNGLTSKGWLALGDAYREQENLPEAIRAWTAGIGRYGPNPDMLDRLAQAHLATGNINAAIQALRTLQRRTPLEAPLNYRLGLLLATRNPEASLEFLDHAARLDPRYQPIAADVRRALISSRMGEDPAYTLLSIGRVLAAHDEWSVAAENFRQAVLARPDYAEAWAYLGEARQHPDAGSLQLPPSSDSDGLPELTIAHDLDPQSLSTHTFLALYWTRKAQFDTALETMREAIALEPNNPALHVQYASVQASSGDFAGAYETYLRAIDLSPYDPAYRRYLVEFSLEYDYEVESLALPAARLLVTRHPDDPANLDLMARVLIEQGDLDSAERFLQRALDSDAQYAPAHMHMGLVYAMRGDRTRALKELDLAIALAAGTPTAAQAQRLMELYFP
jgi:tetratricopeptide (TPR) repeat protein